MLFAKGLLLGLAIAAPLGPIGALCISRTLDRGFWAGVAAVSARRLPMQLTR
ncbi:hypothetical protein SAMCFNEI73_pC0742 (plasmid) [Sinorhizobium americanum]|uniref:Uncharacterized protein n=1 Tax=Sinorhizobium americanum TaxID=194963 RepID=A0A1L3LWG9_9HYPH|nr:hypothetical protein SAMCFNEI73_pC0742 [Sinorhizobium americanum]